MVDHQSPALNLAFGALSDPTRRAMLFRIAEHEATVTELAEPYDMSIAAVSKHLMVLERAHLITKIRDGRSFICRINPEPFKDVAAVLEHLSRFWADRLDALEAHFRKKNTKGSDAHEKSSKTRAPQSRAEKGHSRPKK